MRSYGLPVAKLTAEYVERIYQWPTMRTWIEAALREYELVVRKDHYRELR